MTTPKTERRRFRPTQSRLLLGLLVASALLWLSDRLGWLAPANVILRHRQRLAREHGARWRWMGRWGQKGGGHCKRLAVIVASGFGNPALRSLRRHGAGGGGGEGPKCPILLSARRSHCKRRAVNSVASSISLSSGNDLQMEISTPKGGVLPSASFLDGGRMTAPLTTTSPALKRKVQPRNRPDLPSSPPENFTMGRFAAVFIGILIVVGDAGAGPLPTFGSHGGGRWRAA